MGYLLTRFIAVAASLSLAACASASKPTFNHLDAGARQHIKSVDSVLVAKQKRIGADISQNSTLTQLSALIPGSVMIPALVDMGVTSVRSISANKHAKPMREMLENHDYAWEFRKQIRHSLGNSTVEGIDKVAIVRNEPPGFRGGFIAESEADAVLFVDLRYAFTPKFDNLYVTTLAMLFPNKPELQAFQEKRGRSRVIELSDNIYRNQFVAAVPVGIKDGTKAENAAWWAEKSEEELIELLEVAGLLLSDKMAFDMNLDDIGSDLDLVPEGYVLNTDIPENRLPTNSKIKPASEGIEVLNGGKAEAEKAGASKSESKSEPEPETVSEANVVEGESETES